MKAEIITVNVIAENGQKFKFANHFNAEDTHFYGALSLFVSNNWKMLGAESYEVITKFEDGVQTSTIISGINASAELACFFDEEHAAEYEATFNAYAY